MGAVSFFAFDCFIGLSRRDLINSAQKRFDAVHGNIMNELWIRQTDHAVCPGSIWLKN